MNRNLKVILAYCGTNYHGYQKQANAITIQETVENACSKIFNHKAWIHGVSRTDTGVHARGYCFSVETVSQIPCENFVRAVNTLLPEDIAVLSCEEVSEDFHARYSAQAKEYIYKIYCQRQRDPFLNNFAYHYTYPVNDELMNSACKKFIGTYDFYALCNNYKADIKKAENTIRTIFDFNVKVYNNIRIFTVKGDGFLYNMVRILVGTVLEVNEGKIDVNDLTDIILSKDRSRTGRTVPPYGLYLNKVFY
ncbi:MAG: tRNA pseudouridine(38-40) synthase TruA [Oscillospiraceae bacterium]|jgi:tRNA pseudouridine38-40 synthase|nr:tRNA pseudouridine(38-40) synthase TruA [Oscillospiraceae bacterium]